MAINSETGSEGHKMISAFDLAKAFRVKITEVSSDNNYELAPRVESFEHDVNKAYVRQEVLFGDDFPLGMEDDSADLQYGIYQIDVLTPKSNDAAEAVGLKMIGVYKEAFKRGVTLEYNGQSVRMEKSATRRLDTNIKHKNENHLTTILSVRYSVIN